ncbi:MAG: sulfurtransferase-like selenium metabolism protein YedF [Thermodesulfobacteriota bacterium]
MKEIDATNQACPAPVLITKQTIEGECPDTLKVIVDNEAACQNVTRFFRSKDYEAEVESCEQGYIVIGVKSGAELQPAQKEDSDQHREKKIMVMLTTDRMGHGDDTLGGKLIVNFVNTLREMEPDLWRVVLVNNGVRLAVEGSDVLPALQQLEKHGVGVLVCGTCLDHYGLLDQKKVGDTTNMLDIVTAMQLSDQVINI